MSRLGSALPSAALRVRAYQWAQVTTLSCHGVRGVAHTRRLGDDEPETGSTAEKGGTDADAARKGRAEQIRKQEQRMRWLRALVIPAFTLYGLFILRPTEGHFLRYLAERRHLDPSFNTFFPPLVKAAEEEEGAEAPMERKKKNAVALSTPREATMSEDRDKDREWLRRRLHMESTEDEERVARRRLLFGREHDYSASASGGDGQVPMVVKSAEQRQEELDELRKHPPMHLLSDQLNAIAALSREYHSKLEAADREGPALGPVAPPPIEISFRDRTFFANASVTLHGPGGETVETMHFVGACGMMWKQIA